MGLRRSKGAFSCMRHAASGNGIGIFGFLCFLLTCPSARGTRRSAGGAASGKINSLGEAIGAANDVIDGQNIAFLESGAWETQLKEAWEDCISCLDTALQSQHASDQIF